MAKGLNTMPITIDVKPDFSGFRMPTAGDIADKIGCDIETAQKILESYTILPR